MHKYLEQLFKKRGISDIKDLSDEEREEFDRSSLLLSKKELSLNDVKAFCQTQVTVIKGKWQDYNITQAEKAELIPYFTVYSSLLSAIDSPMDVREMEEKRLLTLIKN